MTDRRRVLIAQATYGDAEIAASTRVLQHGHLALVDGEECRAFEATFAAMLGVRHGLLVNSGSSANLLALAALELPPGSEVITPALTFGTTVAPLLQLGLVPVFVDVAPGRLVVDGVAHVAEALSPRTRALLIPDLLGDVPDWAALRAFADAHGLALVADSADTTAPRWRDRSTAAWANLGTTSFYGSHMLTLAGTGGLVATDDATLATRVRQLRGWGRRTARHGEPEAHGQRTADLDGIAYDAKYVFDVPGYNVLASEVSAAFGRAQLERLPAIREARARHVDHLARVLARWPDTFEVPALPPEATTTWHAFAFRLRPGASIRRADLAKVLERRGVQTRAVLAGNITRHPMVTRAAHRVAGSLAESDAWMRRGLMIGCHQSLTEDDLAHVEACFEEALS